MTDFIHKVVTAREAIEKRQQKRDIKFLVVAIFTAQALFACIMYLI